jgi:hypothetical protein
MFGKNNNYSDPPWRAPVLYQQSGHRVSCCSLVIERKQAGAELCQAQVKLCLVVLHLFKLFSLRFKFCSHKFVIKFQFPDSELSKLLEVLRKTHICQENLFVNSP